MANEGIAVNTGAKNIEIRKRNAVVSAVRPVLPPTATPAEDSTNVVVVDVPRTAPTVVATESEKCRLYRRKSSVFIKHFRF